MTTFSVQAEASEALTVLAEGMNRGPVNDVHGFLNNALRDSPNGVAGVRLTNGGQSFDVFYQRGQDGGVFLSAHAAGETMIASPDKRTDEWRTHDSEGGRILAAAVAQHKDFNMERRAGRILTAPPTGPTAAASLRR